MKITKRILAALCAVLLMGCGQSEPEPEPEPPALEEQAAAEEPTPTAGGALRLPMRLPQTLNPLLNEDITVSEVLRLVFEPLLELDSAQKPVNNLADNVNLASDGLSVIITLKDGLKWADGEPITADDIRYSLDVLKSAPERAVYKSSIRNISGYSVMDELNIKLSYIQSFGGHEYLLCFPIIPEHFYKTAEGLEEVLGNGLYAFSGFTEQKLMTLTASEDTFGRKPYISEVQAFITSDRETDLHSFEQGLTDLVCASISDWGKYLNSIDTNTDSYQTTYFDFIGFNFAESGLSDIRVRQAVAHAIDKDKLLNDIYMDCTVVNAPVDAGWLFEPNTTAYAFDLERSGELFQEAGIRELRVLVNEENEERLRIAALLKENMEQAGVSVNIEQESFAEYERRLSEGDFELVVAGFYLSVMPELTFAFGTDAEHNYFSYSDEVMDGLLSDVFSAVGESAYRKSVSDLQKFFADELPCISLVFRKSVMLTDGKVRGEKAPTIANPFTGMEQWYVYE